MLEIIDLTKRYGGREAITKINLTIGKGEIVGLFGENGAGKTTLMKSVLGLIPSRGTVMLDGEKVSRKNIHRLSFATGEHSFFPNISAASHRDFYREHFINFRNDRFSTLMDFFSLPMHKNISSFSTGQKNQFEVILSLCQGAEYIFMDEPFVGNDIFNREDFYKVLLGILEDRETLVLSTHLIEEVENFISRAVLLHKGRIAGDFTTDELEENGETLIDVIKKTLGYQPDRVKKAIDFSKGGDNT